jgi:hypothetical protein
MHLGNKGRLDFWSVSEQEKEGQAYFSNNKMTCRLLINIHIDLMETLFIFWIKQ